MFPNGSTWPTTPTCSWPNCSPPAHHQRTFCVGRQLARATSQWTARDRLCSTLLETDCVQLCSTLPNSPQLCSPTLPAGATRAPVARVGATGAQLQLLRMPNWPQNSPKTCSKLAPNSPQSSANWRPKSTGRAPPKDALSDRFLSQFAPLQLGARATVVVGRFKGRF